jgi:hypothetical protein
MKRLLAVAALIAIVGPAASEDCPGGLCEPRIVCAVGAAVLPGGRCGPPLAPGPSTECRVLIRYTPDKPAEAVLELPARQCDRPGVELALAKLLAQLLGAP